MVPVVTANSHSKKYLDVTSFSMARRLVGEDLRTGTKVCPKPPCHVTLRPNQKTSDTRLTKPKREVCLPRQAVNSHKTERTTYLRRSHVAREDGEKNAREKAKGKNEGPAAMNDGRAYCVRVLPPTNEKRASQHPTQEKVDHRCGTYGTSPIKP